MAFELMNVWIIRVCISWDPIHIHHLLFMIKPLLLLFIILGNVVVLLIISGAVTIIIIVAVAVVIIRGIEHS